jgi:nucleoside 2-deoxyribosyltransferase
VSEARPLGRARNKLQRAASVETMPYTKCFICDNKVAPFEWGSKGSQIIECKVCLPYRIGESVVRGILTGELREGHVLSGAIRELNERGREVVVNNLDELRDSVAAPQGPHDQIDRILLYVLRKMESADAIVEMELGFDYSVAYAKSPSEFYFLLNQAVQLDYLEAPSPSYIRYRLTLDGWKRVAELEEKQVKTNQAFVAMSFDPNLRSVYLEGIKPALNQTGYVPLRLDEAQYNEKIDDRIIADIRKSGLVIADFTQHKAGVYFEAGFALGLGIPVIWTCRDTEVAAAHFDTRQYNHIGWTDASDLRERLIARIEATIPGRTQSTSGRVRQ